MIRRLLVLLIVILVGGGILVRHFREPDNLMPANITSLKDWKWVQINGASGQVSLDGGAIRIDILKAAGNQSDLYLYHQSSAIYTGRRYHISFKARGDQIHKVILSGSSMYAGKGSNIGLYNSYLIDKDWSTYEITFKAAGQTGADTRIPAFDVGDKAGTIWIKDIMIEPVN